MTRSFAVAIAVAVASAACGEKEQPPIEPPEPLSENIPLVYPLELWDQNISGQTVVLLRISELGAVDSVSVATSSGYEEFDSAAVRGVRTMQFTPAKQGDRRVAMWTKLPVRFSRDTLKMGLERE
jgi:periplasmic protein TonB